MATLRAPYMRQVVSLGIIAAALVAIAIVSVIVTRSPPAHAFKPEPYFPGLAAHISEIRRIHIQDKSHATDLTYAPETSWVVPDKDGYRARYDQIQKLALAFVNLERYEKKTSDPKWFKRLLLTDPRDKGGEATLVQLFDSSSKPLAELLIGSNADVDASSGKQEIYVRKPGDNQVWLARGSDLVPISAVSGDWLDTSIVDVPKKRIARAEIAVAGEPPYDLVHASPEADNFTIESMPAGMKLQSETSANGVGTFLSDLSLRDVANADRITFTPGSTTATYTTFDGLELKVDTVKLGDDTWIRLAASTTDKANAQAKAEAADLAHRLAPWVFEIESWKAEQIETKLSSLIEPVKGETASADTKAATAPAPVAAAPSHQNEQKKSGVAPKPSKP